MNATERADATEIRHMACTKANGRMSLAANAACQQVETTSNGQAQGLTQSLKAWDKQ